MKVQFILAACVIMMIGTLIFMYQAAEPLSVAVVPLAAQDSAVIDSAVKVRTPPTGSEEARHSVVGANDDVKIPNHQARAGL